MKRIYYLADCQILQKRILELGYEATLYETQEFWEWRSSQFAASWLMFKDQDLYTQPNPPFPSFKEYLEEYLNRE